MYFSDLKGKEVQKGGTYIHISIYIRVYTHTYIHTADSLCCEVGTNTPLIVKQLYTIKN